MNDNIIKARKTMDAQQVPTHNRRIWPDEDEWRAELAEYIARMQLEERAQEGDEVPHAVLCTK